MKPKLEVQAHVVIIRHPTHPNPTAGVVWMPRRPSGSATQCEHHRSKYSLAAVPPYPGPQNFRCLAKATAVFTFFDAGLWIESDVCTDHAHQGLRDLRRIPSLQGPAEYAKELAKQWAREKAKAKTRETTKRP